MDFFIKLSSGKIHEGLGGFVINAAASTVLLMSVILAKARGEIIFETKPGGLIYSILAGIAIGITTILMLKVFALGVNLSIGIPIFRIGIVLIASLLGILLLKEAVSLKYLVGFVLSLIGLYLLVAK